MECKLKSKLDITKLKFRIIKNLRSSINEDNCGDYHGLTIDAKDYGNDFDNQLTLIHELIEYFILKNISVDWKDIDQLDLNLKKDKNSRTYKLSKIAHRVASNVEKVVVKVIEDNRKN